MIQCWIFSNAEKSGTRTLQFQQEQINAEQPVSGLDNSGEYASGLTHTNVYQRIIVAGTLLAFRGSSG